MKSPIDLLAGLWRSIHRLEPDVRGLERDFITLKNRFENEGYGFLTIALPSLCSSLDRGLATGQFTCPYGFKTVIGGTIPAFLSGMFCEVFNPVSGQLVQSPNVRVIKILRNILMLFKKTQLDSDQADLLDQKAKTEFFRCDDVARAVIIPSTQRHLIEVVSSYVLNSLSAKEFELASYKHGPGAVFEGYKGNQKWSSMAEMIKQDLFDVDKFGYDVLNVVLSDLSERVQNPEPSSSIKPKYRIPRSIAKLITVPKNSTSRRTITVEPLLNQFIQQGLNTMLRDSINECRILSNCLALTDQSINQKLALDGSLTDEWATLDLKSASDLLSIPLITAVFGRHPYFLKEMLGCRSSFVQVSSQDEPRPLGKFAGMGNALTFPVQSVCFAIICISAILSKQGLKPTYESVRRASRRVRCYGDDIIVGTEVAHQCVKWLEDAGLKVNVNKSFLAGNFKESCGVDAYKGVDVTPIYLRHRPDTDDTGPNTIASLVSTSNQLWMTGLYEASALLAEEVERRLGKRLPLVSRDSGVLGWHTRQDAMTPQKWCRNTHQLLTRAPALISLKRKDWLDGWAALLKFFHIPLLGRSVGHLKESEIRYNSRISWRWVPTNVG